MTNDVFLAALFVLFALDAASTLRFLKLGVREGNPLLARFFRKNDVQEVLLVVKGIAFSVAFFCVDGITSAWRIFILAGYVAVVIWNVAQILERRGG